MSLPAPQNLRATVVSGTEVALAWDPVAGAFSYFIFVDGVSTTASGQPFKNVTGLTPNTEYSFFVTAEAFDGQESVVSGPSNTVTVTTGDATPEVPGSLATPGITTAEQTGVDEATITWGAVTDATGYEVRVDGGAAIDVGNVLGYTTTASLAVGDHTFEVRAYAGAGPDVFSAWSLPSTVSIAGLTAPAPTATVLSSGAIEVTWAAVPPADRYQIRIDNDLVFSVGSLLEYIDSGLAPVTTRSYEVRGLIDGTALVGPWSESISATTNRSIVIEIIGRLRRLSAYLSDRHITARSLNAEFNNIYALLNGGTLTEQGPAGDDTPEDPGGPVTPLPPEDPDAQIAVTPTSLSFSTTNVGGTGGSQSVTVSNPGAVDNLLGNVALNSTDFVVTTDTCSGTTLAPGDTCGLTIAFTPTAGGLRTGQVTLPNQAPSSPLTVELSGIGDAQAPDPGLPDPPTPVPDTEISTVVTVMTDPVEDFSVALPDGDVGDSLLVIRFGATLDVVPETPPGWDVVRTTTSFASVGATAYTRAALGGDTFLFSPPVYFGEIVGNQIFWALRINRGRSANGDHAGFRNNTPLPRFEFLGPREFETGRFFGRPAVVAAFNTFVTATTFDDPGRDPGIISESNFPDLGPMQLVKDLKRFDENGDWNGIYQQDLTFSIAYGLTESLAEGFGAGSGSFSNPDYDDARGGGNLVVLPLLVNDGTPGVEAQVYEYDVAESFDVPLPAVPPGGGYGVLLIAGGTTPPQAMPPPGEGWHSQMGPGNIVKGFGGTQGKFYHKWEYNGAEARTATFTTFDPANALIFVMALEAISQTVFDTAVANDLDGNPDVAWPIVANQGFDHATLYLGSTEVGDVGLGMVITQSVPDAQDGSSILPLQESTHFGVTPLVGESLRAATLGGIDMTMVLAVKANVIAQDGMGAGRVVFAAGSVEADDGTRPMFQKMVG